MTGGLIKIREYQVPAKQVRRIVRRGPPEKLGKHQFHHQKREKRRQHAPNHAQNRALVFLLEISFYQLLKEKLIISQFLKHISYLRLSELALQKVPNIFTAVHCLTISFLSALFETESIGNP